MSLRLATFVIFVLAGVSVQGQTTSPSRVGRPDTVRREKERQVEMQIIEKALMTEGRPTRVKRYPPEVLNEIRDDFLQIQVVDRQLATAASAGGQVDLNRVGQLTGEIRKRGRRLKDNLALPTPEGHKPGTTDTVEVTRERLDYSLKDMSNLIESFVSNPIFEHTKLFDQQLSDKAWRDLNAIINLSDQIKRGAEKLHKAQ